MKLRVDNFRVSLRLPCQLHARKLEFRPCARILPAVAQPLAPRGRRENLRSWSQSEAEEISTRGAIRSPRSELATSRRQPYLVLPERKPVPRFRVPCVYLTHEFLAILSVVALRGMNNSRRSTGAARFKFLLPHQTLWLEDKLIPPSAPKFRFQPNIALGRGAEDYSELFS